MAHTATTPAGVLDPGRLATLAATGLVSDQVFAGLDRLTALATRFLGAPIALVSLVEADRQWFASLAGLPEPWAQARQTPLTHSFCQYVLDADAPLIVQDAREDPRLRNSLAISELGVVAYLGCPLRVPDGTVIGAFCVAHPQPHQWTAAEVRSMLDLTDIAASEVSAHLTSAALEVQRREAAQSRAFLFALLNSLDTGVSACDGRGRLVHFNRALRQLLDADADPDLPAEAWAGRFQVMHPDGRPFSAAEMPLVQALAGAHVRDTEHLMVAADGRALTFVTNAQPILDAGGAVLGAVAATHEVSARRQAEQYREAELGAHRALAGTADVQSTICAVLEAVASALHCVHAELWLDDTGPEGLLYPAATWTVPTHAATVRVPASLPVGSGLAGTVCRTGRPVWVPDTGADPRPLSAGTAAGGGLGACLAVPIRGGEECIGALTMFTAAAKPRDESCLALIAGLATHIGEFLQRRRAERLAAQLAQAKDEYVALVGHELRTPLTSIAAYTDLIRDAGDATPVGDLRELLDVVHRNSTQLRAIVDDLLDLAALDSGHAVVQAGPVDLAGLVRDAVHAASGGPVAIQLVAPDLLPFNGVGQRLRQLLDHLIGNAVKYSPDGGDVTVTLTGPVAPPLGAPMVELTVADTGIGIPDSEREQVFRRFYRSARARERGIPGTGLGLALCRIVADLHHGMIAVVGAGPGTIVVVRLPVTGTAETAGNAAM